MNIADELDAMALRELDRADAVVIWDVKKAHLNQAAIYATLAEVTRDDQKIVIRPLQV